MTIHRLFRARMIVSSIVAVAAVCIGIAGLAAERIYFLPAGMLGVAAIIGFHLAWTSYRFDRGLAGPPEWRKLVGEANEWAEKGSAQDDANAVPATDGPPPQDRT